MRYGRRMMTRTVLPVLMAAGLWPVHASAADAAAGEAWTLQRSIERALAIAPELRMAGADLRAGQAGVEKAGEWPNPRFSVRTQDNIRKMDGRSGYTIDQFTLEQPLPLRRLGYQRRMARQGMMAAEAGVRQSRLEVEARVAQLFLAVQLNHEKMRLAEQRLRFTHKLVRSLRQPGASPGIVRYIHPRDRSRLRLLDETASQDAAAARNGYQEAVDMFRSYLSLADDVSIRLPQLQPAPAPAPLAELQARLDAQTAELARLHHQLQAAEADVELQHVRRFDDPVLTVIREKNVSTTGQVYSFNGVMLTVTLPLWDRNNGNIEQARARVARTESQIAITRRSLSTRLRQDHMQLEHLLAQTQRFRQGILAPARRLLDATERNYEVGATGSLALIDAYNTYFDARNRYLELLFRGHMHDIGIRQTVGQSMLTDGMMQRGGR